MRKISKDIWQQVLERKVKLIQDDIRTKKNVAIEKFEKDSKAVFNQLTKRKIEKAMLQAQIDDIAQEEKSLETNLLHEAAKLGLVNKSICKCGGYRGCANVKQLPRKRRTLSEINKNLDRGIRYEKPRWLQEETEYGYGPLHYSRVEDFLKSTDDPVFVKLYAEFRDLQLKVELSDNEEARRLIEAFLK